MHRFPTALPAPAIEAIRCSQLPAPAAVAAGGVPAGEAMDRLSGTVGPAAAEMAHDAPDATSPDAPALRCRSRRGGRGVPDTAAGPHEGLQVAIRGHLS